MMGEKIKKLLGDELAAKVEEALKGKNEDGTDIEIGVINDGSFFSKEAYDEEKSKNEINNRLFEDIAAAVKEYGGSGDVKTIKKDIHSAIENLKKESEKEILNTKKEYSLRAGLKENGVIDEDCLIFKHGGTDKFSYDENGNVVGLEDVLKTYRDSASYLFKSEDIKLSNAHTAGGYEDSFDGFDSLKDMVNKGFGIE